MPERREETTEMLKDLSASLFAVFESNDLEFSHLIYIPSTILEIALFHDNIDMLFTLLDAGVNLSRWAFWTIANSFSLSESKWVLLYTYVNVTN